MPIYVEIMNQLAEEIKTGKYRPDSCLPSERELCQRFNTSQKSVRNALSHLREKGYIYKKHGCGSFVRQDHRKNGITNLGIVINYSPDHPSVSILSNPCFAQIIKGVNHVVTANNANTSIFIYNEMEEITDDIFTGYQLDGFLNFNFTVTEPLNKYFTEHGIKVVSTASSFQLDRYNKYNHPCIVDDYLCGIEQALKFYFAKELKHFGYFANAAYGLHNYELYSGVLHRNNSKFNVKHTVIYPDKLDTSQFIRERAEYFARTLFGQGIPDVVFSDGDFNVKEMIAFLSESKDGKDILDKVRFCPIGVPELYHDRPYMAHIDFIVPQNERLGEFAAAKLLEYISNGILPENRYHLPAVFVPASNNNRQTLRQR